MEAQIALADATKFIHALAGLDEESITLDADVLSECSYARLKDQLNRFLSPSERAKLLREMKELGDDKFGTELLKSL